MQGVQRIGRMIRKKHTFVDFRKSYENEINPDILDVGAVGRSTRSLLH